MLDADLSKYFDTIPHRLLMRAVARRISDGSVLRLIKQWLRAPVVEEDKNGKRRVLPNVKGTPQGGVISPLLANLYLNPLDWAVNERCAGQPILVRYADDFVILDVKCRSAVVKSAVFVPNCHPKFSWVYDLNADKVPFSAVPPFSGPF